MVPGGYPPGVVATSIRRWRFPATSQYIAHARYVVSAHARWLGADGGAVALAVSEAFTSAVVHASPDAAHPGDVEVIVLPPPRGTGDLRLRRRTLHRAARQRRRRTDADLGPQKMIEQLTTDGLRMLDAEPLPRTRRAVAQRGCG